MIEFVSVNPTGPLHVGHARGAILGSALANILTKTGHAVWCEYYVNDAGTQNRIFQEAMYNLINPKFNETEEATHQQGLKQPDLTEDVDVLLSDEAKYSKEHENDRKISKLNRRIKSNPNDLQARIQRGGIVYEKINPRL